MKKILILAAAAIALGACTGPKIVNQDLRGQWDTDQTVTEQHISYTPTLMFEPTEGSDNAGKVVLVARIHQNMTTTAADTAMGRDIRLEALTTATMQGEYLIKEKDDDDIKVHFDPTTLEVVTEPASIRLSYTVLTDSATAASRLEALRPSALDMAMRNGRESAERLMREIDDIDDVRVAGDTLRCELDDAHLMFRRQ